MLGSAGIADVIAPLGGAWFAWGAVIAIKLWIWSGIGSKAQAAEPDAAFAAALQSA